MLENGVTLAVRRIFLTNLQGTTDWGPDVVQELALVESYYNHNDNATKLLTHGIAAPSGPGTKDGTAEGGKSNPEKDERNAEDIRLGSPCVICHMINCSRLRCFIKIPHVPELIAPSVDADKGPGDGPATDVERLQQQSQPMASYQSGDQNVRKRKNPFPDPFEWQGRKRVCLECVGFTTPNGDADKETKDGPATNAEGLQQQSQPTASYQSGDHRLRKRIFPCPMCGDPADGSHQCGVCFKHVHAICGDPFPGSIEGHGQQRICMECLVFTKPNQDAVKLPKEGPVKRPLSRSDLEAGWRFDEISRIGADFMGRDDRSPALEPGDNFYDL